MVNYEEILNETTWDDLPELKALPDGTYRLRATGAKFKSAEDEDKNDFVVFMYKPQEAADDVDERALAAVGADGPDVSDVAKPVSTRIWIEQAADFHKVKRHLEKHGIDVKDYEEEGNGFMDNLALALKAVRGTEVNAYLTTRTYTDRNGEEVEENQPTTFLAIE